MANTRGQEMGGHLGSKGVEAEADTQETSRSPAGDTSMGDIYGVGGWGFSFIPNLFFLVIVST